MKTLVLDSHAVLAYFEKDAGWRSVAELLHEAVEGKSRLIISVVNWGEVYYITLREYGEEHAERILQALDNMPVEIMDAGREVTMHAAQFKAAGGISNADSFACGLAKAIKGAEIVTGDPEFRSIERHIPVRWI